MAYNPHARRKLIKELEQYGPARDSSGRAINLLHERMQKHGLANGVKQAAIAQLVTKLAKEGILQLNRYNTRTYGIELAPKVDHLKPELVDSLDFAPTPPPITKAPTTKEWEPNRDLELQQLKRQVADLKSQLNAKDALIAGLRREVKQLEHNLETLLKNDRVGYDPTIPMRQLMTTPPGHDRYRS